MVFTIQSQYIDSVGKLRIIYGFHNKYKKQLINLLTFPLPPLGKVHIETHNKVQSFSTNKIDDFITDLKAELSCNEVLLTSTGCWFKNSTFPPSVFIPIDTDFKPNGPIPFPLMIDGVSPYLSELDTYKDRVHKANIFKQYVLFLYSCDPDNYSLKNSFVIKTPPNYNFDKWDPPNWMSLENKKMFVLNPTTFPPLSELSPENFKRLNSERLKMCFEDGKGECQTKYLPKPTDPGKWKEYQSPGGGHGLFHSILRGHAKLNPHKYDLNLIDFDTEKTSTINKNKWGHWKYIHDLRYLIQDENHPAVKDAKVRASENIGSLNIEKYKHFWGTSKDLHALVTKLNICIVVFFKQWRVFSPSEENSLSANKNNCLPERVIFISGDHYTLLVPQDESKEENSIRLIVPNNEFPKRLDFYLQKELQINKEIVMNQKNRETLPNFYNFKTNFKKEKSHVKFFSSREGVEQWFRYKTTSKEYLKCLISSTFHPSETDLARLDSKEEDSDFQKELLEPYFFYHYKINKGNLSLVQNVLSGGKTFDNNLFHALLVSRIWVVYQVNRGSVKNLASIPDLKWNTDDLERDINQKGGNQIFKEYNVVVYSPSGEIINDTETPQAHLIQYKGGYAALLFVSLPLSST